MLSYPLHCKSWSFDEHGLILGLGAALLNGALFIRILVSGDIRNTKRYAATGASLDWITFHGEDGRSLEATRHAAAHGDKAGVRDFVRDVHEIMASEQSGWVDFQQLNSTQQLISRRKSMVGSWFRALFRGRQSSMSVVADHKLTEADFERLARELSRPILRARKIGFVSARQATMPEQVTTHWNGVETGNTAIPGSWIVTNLSPTKTPVRDRDGNTNVYVITEDRFPGLYELTSSQNADGAVYKAKSTVDAIRLPSGLDIIAPWGERQVVPDGYLIRSGGEIYGNQTETFEATFEVLP